MLLSNSCRKHSFLFALRLSMIKVPSQYPYRRNAWRDLLFPAKADKGTPLPELARWVPDNYIKLAEALGILGESHIEGWSGTEAQARNHNAPPDPPWRWRRLAEHKAPEFFTINDADEKVPASEIEAMAWWQSIEPVLVAEWEEEKQARNRLLECREQMRNKLASENLVALTVTESGRFYPIPSNEWIGARGGWFLATGVVEFHIPGSYSSFPIKGPVIFDRSTFSTSEATVETASNFPDLEHFPYLAFMVRASQVGPFTPGTRVSKKTIEQWLRKNWPDSLGEPASNKIINMATFLRRPSDEKGGNHS